LRPKTRSRSSIRWVGYQTETDNEAMTLEPIHPLTSKRFLQSLEVSAIGPHLRTGQSEVSYRETGTSEPE
jgi:hypothetical protein